MALSRIALLLLLLVSRSALADAPRAGVNAVLGDDSYVARFGVAPGEHVDEDLRIRVHLEHVEALLRAADTGALTPAQRAARLHNLDLLHAYRARGEFPRNDAVPGRRPRFIDGEGRICAVGFLIEQTAGRELAEAINAGHEWSYLPEIRGPQLDAWVRRSGLGVHELAMIQPSYGWRPPPHHPRPRPVPDEDELRRRLVMRRLAAASDDVQACADRHGESSRIAAVRVAVTLSRSSVGVDVGRIAGTRGLRACVRRAVERRVAGTYLTRRASLTIVHTFAIDAPAYDHPGFAKPPRGGRRGATPRTS